VVPVVAGIAVAVISLGVVLAILRMFAQPVQEAEGAGRTRSVEAENLIYRCPVCGTEARLTLAPADALPEAPRHCREDMVLVTE